MKGRMTAGRAWPKLESELAGWPGISVHLHRFSAGEFRFERAGVGHVHTGKIIDPRAIRDLLSKGLPAERHWVPDSGWITFQVTTDDDLKHAIWLIGLSFLPGSLKTAEDSKGCLESEYVKLRPSPVLKMLLAQFTAAAGAGEAASKQMGRSV